MDTALLVSLLVCQAITGGLGFYVSVSPPNEKGRKRYLFAFAGLTLFGVVLGAVVGIRAATAIDQMNQQLAWNDRPPMLELNRPLEIILPHDNEGFHINVHFENAGGRAAQRWRFYGTAYLGKRLDKRIVNAWIDSMFAASWSELRKKHYRVANDIQAGDASKFFTIESDYLTNKRIRQAQIEKYMHEAPCYIFVLFSWYDPKTGSEWKSESCYIWAWGSAPAMCDGHNTAISPTSA